MLCSLTYFSERSFGCPDSEVAQIVKESAQRNSKKSITGYLIADNRYFVQTIEGDRAALSALFDTIQADYRHTGVVIAAFQEIDARSYPDWGMAHVYDPALIKAAAAPIIGAAPLEPDRLRGLELQDLLIRARRIIPS